jgi:hypothetical protein
MRMDEYTVYIHVMQYGQENVQLYLVQRNHGARRALSSRHA